MMLADVSMERPANEPVLSYAPGRPERGTLKQELERQLASVTQIPMVIGGEPVRSRDERPVQAPHDHALQLGSWHAGGPAHAGQAVEAALAARRSWLATPWLDRAAIFLRAAELLARRHRPILNAATMLGQSKSVHQAEVDAACELIDFFRFNVYFASRIYAQQPASAAGERNIFDHRPLEGFVFAISPFNFTSIAANLPTAPAIMGNTVVWKPASNAVYSAHFIMELLHEAGLPPGVINMVLGPGRELGPTVLKHPRLSGVHFTGSTAAFRHIWQTVGAQLARYRDVPRMVGETGGKDFVVVHRSAGVREAGTALVRGAFEYQGQKCSAASRAYVAAELWDDLIAYLKTELAQIRMGDPLDFRNFMNAVIDEEAFQAITGYIERARQDAEAEILWGGGADDSKGYFIEPTLVVTEDPRYVTMCEEIFGPVLTLYRYEGARYDEILDICNGHHRTG